MFDQAADKQANSSLISMPFSFITARITLRVLSSEAADRRQRSLRQAISLIGICFSE
jgi:hypothetical protein